MPPYTQIWFPSGEAAGDDAKSGRGAFIRRHISVMYAPTGDSEQPAATISHFPLNTSGLTVPSLKVEAGEYSQGDAVLIEKFNAAGAFITGELGGADIFSIEGDGDAWTLGTMYAHKANVGGIAAAVDGTTALDMTQGNLFTCTPAENTSWSISAPPADGIGGQRAAFVVDNSGGFTVAWAAGFTDVDSIGAGDTGIHVRLLQFDGTTWHQIAAVEDGEATNIPAPPAGGAFRVVALANLVGPDSAGTSLPGDANAGYNFFGGDLAGEDFVSGDYNTFLGATAGMNAIQGNYNVGIGPGTLDSLNNNGFDAYGNVAIGLNAGNAIDDGEGNVLIGIQAGLHITTGDDNIVLGEEALEAETTGSSNIAIGDSALNSTSGAFGNIAIGEQALESGAPALSGMLNIGIGWGAGSNWEGDSNRNIALGYNAGPAGDTVEDDKIYIGNGTLDIIVGDMSTGEWGIDGYLQLLEQNADAPGVVVDGAHLWVSDGTGTGDEGDGYVTVHTGGNPGTDYTFKFWDAATGAAGGLGHIGPFNIQNPSAVQDNDNEFCIWPITDADLTIESIRVTLDAAGNQVLGDLKYCDAFISLANPVVINSFDTTAGVRYDDSITVGAVPSGKCIYLSFDSQPHADITQMCVHIRYSYD